MRRADDGKTLETESRLVRHHAEVGIHAADAAARSHPCANTSSFR
jgi:hypothetical protein